MKYNSDESNYDMIFRCCLALKNVHVRQNPLRADDSDWYNQYRNRLLAIGEEKKKKRILTQQKYRSKPKIRFSLEFCDQDLDMDDATHLYNS